MNDYLIYILTVVDPAVFVVCVVLVIIAGFSYSETRGGLR